MRITNFARIAGAGVVLLSLASPTHPLFAPNGSEGRARQSDKEIQELLATIRDQAVRNSQPERVAKAIQRLGKLRATEAIEDLCALLAFRVYWPWERDPTVPISAGIITAAQTYPAVGALRDMGEDSVPALITVIGKHEPTSLETRNALEVIVFLSRYKRSEYVTLLKDAAAKATSPQAADRLGKAAEELQRTKR